ncbi:hypothetical protein [Pseudonocardia sp. D17]|uniref:hypothetical protein n=1 Tax=Pseudonocardia sp. D17 TaxID=882661 RepID=UPI002B38C9F2|nr:hypothetical protein PSD17_39260 [Pseudonocardia sp. D17]
MGQNTSPGPVVTAATVQAILAAIVTLGWVRLDDTATAAVATAIAAVIAAVTTWVARSHVTPVANPVDASGTPLVPAQTVPDATAAPPVTPPAAASTTDDPAGRHALRDDGGTDADPR